MWEKFLGCFKKKGKVICRRIKLYEIEERVPSNQRKHFQKFVQQHEIYKARVQKYPERLPSIDWNYYRANVRPGYTAWVDGFEKQYAQFNTVFDSRSELVDTTRYFAEINNETEELKEQIIAFKKESNCRIDKYTEQIEELSACTPFRDMTMEEFCYAYPELAPDFLNKPTFWPHTPEEQKPGPATAKDKHKDPIKPSTTPSKTSPSGDGETSNTQSNEGKQTAAVDQLKKPASGEKQVKSLSDEPTSSKEALLTKQASPASKTTPPIDEKQSNSNPNSATAKDKHKDPIKPSTSPSKTSPSGDGETSNTQSNEGKQTTAVDQLKKPASGEKQVKYLSDEPTSSKEALLTKQASPASKTTPPIDEKQSNSNPNSTVKIKPPSSNNTLPTEGSSDMPSNKPKSGQLDPSSEDLYGSEEPEQPSPCEILHCDVDPCEDGSIKIPCPKEVYGPGPCEVPGRQPKPPCPEGYVPWEPDLYDPEPDRSPSIGPCPDGYKPSRNRAFPCDYQICEIDKDPCSPCPGGYEPCKPPKKKKPKKKKMPCPDNIPPCPDGFQPCSSKPSKKQSKTKETPHSNDPKSKKEPIVENTKKEHCPKETPKKEPSEKEKQMPSKSKAEKDTSFTIKSETNKTEPSVKSKSGMMDYKKNASPSNVTVSKLDACPREELHAKIDTCANYAPDDDPFSCDELKHKKYAFPNSCDYQTKPSTKNQYCPSDKQTSISDCKELKPTKKPCSSDEPTTKKESEFDPYKPVQESSSSSLGYKYPSGVSPCESKTDSDVDSSLNDDLYDGEVEFEFYKPEKNGQTCPPSYECPSDYSNRTWKTKSNEDYCTYGNQEHTKYDPSQTLKTDETSSGFNNITTKISTVNAISTNKFPTTSLGAPIQAAKAILSVEPVNATSNKINMDRCDKQIEQTSVTENHKRMDICQGKVENTSKTVPEGKTKQKDFGFVIKANNEIHSVKLNQFDSTKKSGWSAEISKGLKNGLQKEKDSNKTINENNKETKNTKSKQPKKSIIITTKDVDKLKNIILPHPEPTQLEDTSLKSKLNTIIHEDPTYAQTEQAIVRCHKLKEKTCITNNSCFNASTTNMPHNTTESSDVREIKDVSPVTIIKSLVETNGDFDLQPDNMKINGLLELPSEVSQLVENANQSFEKAKVIHENRLQALEDATKQASLAADRAIKEATKAVDAAKKLKSRALNDASEENSRAFKMAKKHSQLASHLAIRALELKKETKTMLDEIKKKQAENKKGDKHN